MTRSQRAASKFKSRALHLEALESRALLATATTTETFRPFVFNLAGNFSGRTTFPPNYVDNYRGSDTGTGRATFTSPTEGSAQVTEQGTGTGRDNFGSYAFRYSGNGLLRINDGVLNFLAGNHEFEYTQLPPGVEDGSGGFNPWAHNFIGSFDPLTWDVSVSWNKALEGGGTSRGSYSGSLSQPNLPLPDLKISSGEFLTAQAEAIADDDHSLGEVAAKVGAKFVIDVTGQHIKTPNMGDTVATVQLYWAKGPTLNDKLGSVIAPIPVHWNTGKITVTLEDLFGANTPPENATHLIAVVDDPAAPGLHVTESNENNNVKAVPIPYDFRAKAFGWLDGGTPHVADNGEPAVLFSFDVAEAGIPGGRSFTSSIYWADAAGRNLGTLGIKTVTMLSTPAAVDGDFLLGLTELTRRPEGAVKLVAKADSALPGRREINETNNALELKLADIEVTSLRWLNTATGTAEVKFRVANSRLPYNTSIAVAFTNGPAANARVIQAKTVINLSQNMAPGEYTRTITVGNLAARPAGATHLRLRADTPSGSLPMGTILETNEANNVRAISANIPPVVTLNQTSVAYSRGATLLLVPQARVVDPDSPNFDTGRLIVRIEQGASAADQLRIRHQGTGSGQIGISGNQITYGGTVIGTFSGGNGAAQLTISFNAKATVAATQALVRNLTFRVNAPTPVAGARTLSFQLNDGDTGVSSKVTMQVRV